MNNDIQAFPAIDVANGRSIGGMSLRDYFAAKAMRALLSKDNTFQNDYIPWAAYEIADAMLAARNSSKDAT